MKEKIYRQQLWILYKAINKNEAASGDEPGAAIFMSIFFIKIGLIPVGTKQNVRHPVWGSAHLCADYI